METRIYLDWLMRLTYSWYKNWLLLSQKRYMGALEMKLPFSSYFWTPLASVTIQMGKRISVIREVR